MVYTIRLCNLDIPLVLDVDPLMFEGSRAYGLSKVQTGREFRGLGIINSLKKGKQIIFTATGLLEPRAPAAYAAWNSTQ